MKSGASASEGRAQRRPPGGARSFFDVAVSARAPFLTLCNFEDAAFEVGLISSFFLICFVSFFFSHHLFLLGAFFFFF